MNYKPKCMRSVITIVTLCMVFTFAFVSVGPVKVYAAVDEQIYEPVETVQDILAGKDVPVSKNYQALIQYNISTGGTRFKGSGECWGYAEKVRRMFGNGGGRRTTVGKKTSAASLYKILKNVKPGTHVRFGYKKNDSGAHSIAVYKVTKDKMYFSDGNWDRNNCIRHLCVDIDYFTKYPYLQWYIQPTGGYTSSSTSIVGYSYDLQNKIELAWKPVSGAKSYTVYRATSKNGKYVKLKTVNGPIYTDNKAKTGANYYKVKPNNRGMSAAKVIYNKLTPPTVRVNATKQGYAKLTWNKISGAKKYGIYKSYYDKNYDLKYKLLKTVTGTSYVYKGSDTESIDVCVRAIASNSKANSAYTNAEVHRFAPKAKIISIEPSKDQDYPGSYVINAGVLYDPSIFDYLSFDLYRSESKKGSYQWVGSAVAYGKEWGDDIGLYKKSKYNYQKSKVMITDYSLDYGKNYYYKLVANVRSGDEWFSYYYSGLDSAVKKIKTPDISTTEEAVSFGGGEYHKYADGTIIYFIDSKGVKYTKGLELNYWGDILYFMDDNGQKYMIEDDGSLYKYDSEGETYRYVLPDEDDTEYDYSSDEYYGHIEKSSENASSEDSISLSEDNSREEASTEAAEDQETERTIAGVKYNDQAIEDEKQSANGNGDETYRGDSGKAATSLDDGNGSSNISVTGDDSEAYYIDDDETIDDED